MDSGLGNSVLYVKEWCAEDPLTLGPVATRVTTDWLPFLAFYFLMCKIMWMDGAFQLLTWR